MCSYHLEELKALGKKREIPNFITFLQWLVAAFATLILTLLSPKSTQLNSTLLYSGCVCSKRGKHRALTVGKYGKKLNKYLFGPSGAPTMPKRAVQKECKCRIAVCAKE